MSEEGGLPANISQCTAKHLQDNAAAVHEQSAVSQVSCLFLAFIQADDQGISKRCHKAQTDAYQRTCH